MLRGLALCVLAAVAAPHPAQTVTELLKQARALEETPFMIQDGTAVNLKSLGNLRCGCAGGAKACKSVGGYVQKSAPVVLCPPQGVIDGTNPYEPSTEVLCCSKTSQLAPTGSLISYP